MKKIIAIVLALVIAVGIMAIPVAAASVQPHYPVGRCFNCGEEAEFRGANTMLDLYQYFCNECKVWSYLPMNNHGN